MDIIVFATFLLFCVTVPFYNKLIITVIRLGSSYWIDIEIELMRGKQIENWNGRKGVQKYDQLPRITIQFAVKQLELWFYVIKVTVQLPFLLTSESSLFHNIITIAFAIFFSYLDTYMMWLYNFRKNY